MDINDTSPDSFPEFPDIDEHDIPEVLPLMAVRDVVIFNYMIIPLFVGRPTSIAAVNEALTKDKMLMLATQKDATTDDPDPEDIYDVGMDHR